MLTLSDINHLTNSHDGDIYSDLYKDVYGSRPRGSTFESVEAFDEDFQFLSRQNDRQIARQKSEQDARWGDFLCRIETVKQLIIGCDVERAIKFIAESEGVSEDDIKFYGWSVLEFELNLKYGSIKQFLESEAQNESFLEEIAG